MRQSSSIDVHILGDLDGIRAIFTRSNMAKNIMAGPPVVLCEIVFGRQTAFVGGDPDLEESDPFDDEVLQFFIKNITKEEMFDCFITSEEKKLYSHLTGETDFSEETPISLDGKKLILLRCSLYY